MWFAVQSECGLRLKVSVVCSSKGVWFAVQRECGLLLKASVVCHSKRVWFAVVPFKAERNLSFELRGLFLTAV